MVIIACCPLSGGGCGQVIIVVLRSGHCGKGEASEVKLRWLWEDYFTLKLHYMVVV